MKDDPLVHEDEDTVPVRSRRVSGNANDGAVEGVPVFQPVFEARAHRWIVKLEVGWAVSAQLGEESGVHAVVPTLVWVLLGISYVRDPRDG
jgi:hypothetical protein